MEGCQKGQVYWYQGLVPSMKNILKIFSSIVYPAKCIACGAVSDEKHICAKCLCRINILDHRVTSREHEHYDTLHSLTAYEGPMLDAIRHFKYGKSRISDGFIASLLKESTFNFGGSDLIVPVPLSIIRYAKRGYNQADIIARYLSKHFCLPVLGGALSRKIFSGRQVGKGLSDRRLNVRGAFCLSERAVKKIAGKRVLLVDDVVTSGSTVDECARVLKKGKAERVDVLTIAKTL